MSRRDNEPQLDDLLRTASPRTSVEEARALAKAEARLFGRSPRVLSLSRYVLLDRLGSGGAGAVFRAYDPELDRKVAMKLLLAMDPKHSGVDRLLGEAQLMAKLNHPNVVSVYDTGRYNEQDLGYEPGRAPPNLEVPREGVFLVMELVKGDDLEQWLGDETRSATHVVRIFADAARGLSAVHEAGLVHRDFTTHNVRIDPAGRVVVLDLGLARPVAPDHPGAGPVGTQPYISPEQYAGKPADAQSDQFAFGVALYRALVGSWPFSGSLEEMVAAKLSGRWAPIPASVPRRLRGVIARTLAPDPTDRYPNMLAVEAALRESARIQRRWQLALAGAALIGVIGYAVVRTTVPDPPICEGGPDQWAQIWDESTTRRVRTAFLETGEPFAAATFDSVDHYLRDYGRAWIAMRRDACEATQIRAEQSEALMDLRMACLDRRRSRVRALVRQLSQPDPKTVERAAQAAYALPNVSDCADAEALLAQTPPPADEATRKAVAQVRTIIDDARALESTGRLDEALTQAQLAHSQAQQINYPPTQAEALFTLGLTQVRDEDYKSGSLNLRAAMFKAQAVGDFRLAARASCHLADADNAQGKAHDRVQLWVDHATSLFDHSNASAADRLLLVTASAVLASRRKQSTEAERFVRQAIALGTTHNLKPDLQRQYANLGGVLIVQGRTEEGLAALQESVRLLVDLGGEAHPELPERYGWIAEGLRELGRFREARSYLDRAESFESSSTTPFFLLAGASLALNLGQYDEVHSRAQAAEALIRKTAGNHGAYRHVALRLLGYALLGMDRLEAAEGAFRRAYDIARATDPDDLSRMLDLDLDLTEIDFESGNYEQVLAARRDLLAAAMKAWPDDGARVRLFHAELGYVAARLDRRDEARTQLQRALELKGRPHTITVNILLALAEVDLADNRVSEARSTTRRAESMVTRTELDPQLLARLDFITAQLTWADGNHAKARALARAAQKTLRRAQHPDAYYVQRVRNWVAEHEGSTDGAQASSPSTAP